MAKEVEVSFKAVWMFDDNATEEYMYEVLLEYLHDCVKTEDVTAFNFEEIKDSLNEG
jgi:hypothetical protein